MERVMNIFFSHLSYPTMGFSSCNSETFGAEQNGSG